MKAPSFYSALTLSFFFHIAVITLSFFIGRELYTRNLVPPYVVSLVEPSQTAGSEKASASSSAQPAAAPEIARPVEKPRVEARTEPRRKKEQDTTLVKNRIEELKAIQKLERLAALRKIIDIGAGQRALESKNSSTASRNNITGSGGAGGGDYYSLVEGKIRQQWVYPETLDTDLQTVVSIRIAKDGSITIEKVEKGSGNQLFDRSVLRAIAMASPLPPPLKEMEIGLRFRP